MFASLSISFCLRCICELVVSIRDACVNIQIQSKLGIFFEVNGSYICLSVEYKIHILKIF